MALRTQQKLSVNLTLLGVYMSTHSIVLKLMR